jgi:methylmalonyl-CoA mutase
VSEGKNRFDMFEASRLKEWEAAAKEELNGANPWEKLARTSYGLTMQPYYDETSVANVTALLPVSGNEYLGPRSWFNCPRIVVDDEKKCNARALSFLQKGADGILFELSSTVDFNVLLENIDVRYCALNFLAKENQGGLATSLRTFLDRNVPGSSALEGAFFGNVSASTATDRPFIFSGFQIHASSNAAMDVAAGFNTMLSSTGAGMSQQFARIAFSVTIGNDFFIEIAKLRSIRVVWKKLVEEKKIKNEKLFIHAISVPWVDKNYDPHGSMLKSTTAAMASILGGCDALTVDAEDNGHPTMSRIALNVSNILREESFFSKVADPAAGSYFVESITAQIADSAWESIRKI